MESERLWHRLRCAAHLLLKRVAVRIVVGTVMSLAGCGTSLVAFGGALEAKQAEAGDLAAAPSIRIADPRAFLRELSALGSSTSIADRELILRLTGWRPNFVAAGDNAYRAADPVRDPSSNIGYLTLSWGTKPPGESGSFRIDVRPDAYCVQLSDAVSVFGEPAKTGRPLHVRPREAEGLIHTAVFANGPAVRVVLTFAYKACAQSVDVIKDR